MLFASRPHTLKTGLLAVFLLIGISTTARGETIPVGQSDSIEFDRVWWAILEQAGISASLSGQQFAKKRDLFVRGEILLDCCAISEWRERPEEKAVQLFSDPFFSSTEHFVTRADTSIDIVADADKLRFVMVRGFTYPLEFQFESTIEASDIDEALDLLASGSADVGIASQRDFDRRMRLKSRPLQLGPVLWNVDLRIRVHKSRKDLLPKINEAIATLKQTNRIQAILDRQDAVRVPSGDHPGSVMVGRSDTTGTQRMWREILTEAGIQAVFVNAPQERKRRMFVEGRIVLDCCAAPIWRTRPREQEVQHWSDTFYVSREIWVFRRNQPFPVANHSDLAKLRVAAVRGFDFLDQAHFGARIPGEDVDDTLTLLAFGRADATIMGELDFLSRAGLGSQRFMRGPLRVEADQKIRAHTKVKGLLPRINEAIARLKANGRFDAIVLEIAKKTGSSMQKPEP